MGDTEYFAARERAERALANEALSTKVRDIHLALAEKYAALAVGKTEPAENENENNFSGEAHDVG